MNAPFQPSTAATYGASPIKRSRATKEEVTHRRAYLLELVREQQPMTVRQVFYQATVVGLVEKAETGYSKVQNDLVLLRSWGLMPYGWLIDNTRWQRKPRSYSSVEEALRSTAAHYRKALWQNADAYVEIWIEKDALAGVAYEITEQYDVPLMVARGFSSLSFLHSAAEHIATLDVPAFIYHFGDYDPSGVGAAKKIEAKLREFAPRAEIHFSRQAVTREQVAFYNLPSRPTKGSDSRSKSFGDEKSVELDAFPPQQLKAMIERCINHHLPYDQLRALQVAEDSERQILSLGVERFVESVPMLTSWAESAARLRAQGVQL